MRRSVFTALVLVALEVGTRAEDPPKEPAPALKGFDPVELAANKEVARNTDDAAEDN